MPPESPYAVQPAPNAGAIEVASVVRDIMGRPPHWLMRSGIMIIFGLIIALLALSCLVRYPDTINAPITVTGVNPALGVVARQSGHLKHLYATENQMVEQGQVLGVIESAAEASQVFAVRDEVEKLLPFLADPSAYVELSLGSETALGSVQGGYTDFLQADRRYRNLLRDDYAEKNIAILQGQLERKRAQVAEMADQVASMAMETKIARDRYDRISRLLQQGTISRAQFEDQERGLLEVERKESAIANAHRDEQIAAAEYERQIRKTTHERDEGLRVARLALAEALKKLLGDIETWEQSYVLRAPTSGRVAFYEFWADQQFVNAGKQVFIIVPGESQMIGRIPVSGPGAGKIKSGQPVRIKFQDYPHKEFGIVSGTVESISLVPKEGAHLVSVSLPAPLTTNYGRTLPSKQDMLGQADIITDDRRLLSRIFAELRRAISPPNEA